MSLQANDRSILHEIVNFVGLNINKINLSENPLQENLLNPRRMYL